MGKIRQNGIIGDVQGKLGDKVIANTKYGEQVKKSPKGHSVIPEGQRKEMNYFEYVAGEYGRLTEQEATWWAQRANAPEVRTLYTKKRYLQGRNLFFSINMKLLDIGEPIIMSLPSFNHAQTFEKITVEIVQEKGKKDIILRFSPEIKEETKLVITATAGVKDNLLYIHPSEYKRIALLDSNFMSGESLRKHYLQVYKSIPKTGMKVSFLIESVNRKCGTSSMPVKRNVHQYSDNKSRVKAR
jgi:hypothetical protein